LILKANQLDEQITKLKRLDRMVFPFKTEPIQFTNTLNFSSKNPQEVMQICFPMKKQEILLVKFFQDMQEFLRIKF